MDGLQIDLDAGEGLVTKGRIYDYVLNPCTKLELEFDCKDLLLFHPNEDNYFRYLTLEWKPYYYKFGHTSENTWWYHVKAFPKQMFTFIEKPCPDIQTLAGVMGLDLGENSTNLPIKCPVIGLPAYAFMRTIRLQSFNDAALKKNLEEGYFLYCNSDKFTASTWKSLSKSEARSLELPEGLQGTEEVRVIDMRMENYLRTPAYPGEWTEEDWLRRMNGVAYEFETLQPASFMSMYTIKFNNTDKLDSPESLICFYTECDLMNLNKMTNRFAQICFE